MILAFLVGMAGQSLAQSNQKSLGADFNGESLRPIQISDIVASKFLKDSTHVFTRTDIDTTWVLSAKRVYKYGNLGEERAVEEFERLEGQWIRNRRLENTFNAELNLIRQREMMWDSSLQEWGLEFEREFSYNFINLISEEVTFRNNGGEWEREVKKEFDYTDFHNVDLETKYNWSEENETWLADSRKVFEYYEADLISKETLQVWSDSLGKWQNQVTRDFEYDENENLISSVRSTWDDVDKLWVNISMVSLQYNEKGQLESSQQSHLGAANPVSLLAQDANYDDDGNLGEIVHSNWNSDTESWEIFKKDQHFWSEKRTGTDIASSNDITCTFPNPYIKGFSWYCESLKTGVNYTLDLYDLTGRHFHSMGFVGGNTFRIRGNFPSGIYVAVIRGGLDVHTEKVIIRD